MPTRRLCAVVAVLVLPSSAFRAISTRGSDGDVTSVAMDGEETRSIAGGGEQGSYEVCFAIVNKTKGPRADEYNKTRSEYWDAVFQAR